VPIGRGASAIRSPSRHRLELSDSEKPPLEHGLTATEGDRRAIFIADWTGVQVTPWQLSREKSLIAKRSENEGKFGPHFKGQFWTGYAGAPESLAGKFRTFGSELVALRRQSLLTIFQFPFRYTRDRSDM
jgi:hypothetical protein